MIIDMEQSSSVDMDWVEHMMSVFRFTRPVAMYGVASL